MSSSDRAALEREAWRRLGEVPDPEVPVLSIVDLGIVRELCWDGARLIVVVTPTYSGCPATEVIAESIRMALTGHGVENLEIRTRLSPAWTTDWLSADGREKLRRYGIAPPASGVVAEQVIDARRILRAGTTPEQVCCPRCGSSRTDRISAFGSTPCKALYRCSACREPFDYFKPH